ncbi:small subunit processome component 20 homolog [Contarinia nasturtii]|uniref:small subunit processome component 20 homolog n=1 Tax=Contarinia nasturtii TaxID=265458 RepID=UPI0012D3B886|nr:small subunit processome component 20 homolog [Contarinia nasturtii]
MKNKPQRHKETNSFRFKTFGERLNEIDLRRTALYRIRHQNEGIDEEVQNTEFHQTYCKWIVLNLTEEYAIFQKQIRNVVTLPQLLLKKEFVINKLVESLEKATALSLQPLLEFVVALAKDLREDLYVHLVKSENPLFETLFNLLKTKDSDQLEWTLICLAHLFKVLKPYLKKDFSAVFKLLLPLLDNDNSENITNFAVECFAFIARDIADKEKFLLVILSQLKISKEQSCSDNIIRGCSQLLFEVIRGVNGQFHSCAESYLRAYLEMLSKLKTHQSVVWFEILNGMVMILVQNIAPVNIQIFWDACYRTLEYYKSATNLNSLALKHLLFIMGHTLEIRDGKFLINPNQFVTEVIKVIDTCEDNEDCLRCTSDLITVLLLSHNVILTQLDASRITKKVLTIPSTEIFEAFVWNCVKYSQFEVLILPEFLRYIDSHHFGMSSLELMAKIILYKSPLFSDGISIDAKKIYPIRLRSEKCLQKIESILTTVSKNGEYFDDSKEFLLALIVYPHIVGAEVNKILAKVNEQIEVCLNALKPHTVEILSESENMLIQTENKRILFILSILIETQIHLRQLQVIKLKPSNNAEATLLKRIVEKLVKFGTCENYRYIHTLRMLDLIVSFEASKPKEKRSSDFNIDLFKIVHNELSNNLLSRYHNVRRITAHLLHQFSDVLKTKDMEFNIYGVFFDIESIDTNIHTYREQLLLFQRIEPTTKLLASLSKVHEPSKYDPLKYLLGFLHVNFNLLWKPITELISTYFSELEIESFWSIFKMQIDETTTLLRNKQLDEVQDDVEFIDVKSCLRENYLTIWHNDERPIDLVNYRILMWRIIPLLGMLREIKNREIVTIFLDFIEHEYKRTIDRDTYTLQAQRKRKIKKSIKAKGLNENENEDIIDNDVNEDDNDDEQITDDQKLPAGTQRTLTNMLQVFVNQNNPKALHREPELWNLYLELLSHRNSEVQKLALDCIFAYKHKYLQPYMDYLKDLVDDAKFKSAIISFKIDKASGLVQLEHRPQLMPIVIRILYSKMLQRIGGQKTSNQTRKSLVMRFLGGCHEEEILIMLHMSFWMLEIEFKDDARVMCQNVMAKTNAGNVLSPNILQSSLDLLDVIQSEFSGLMSNKFLRYIINVLLVIGSTVFSIVEQSKCGDSKITSDLAKPFKNLRNNCYQNLQRFFDHFESYPWNDNEIDAIFLVFVSPSAHKLAQESLLSVTPLHKLFTTFGKYPRLFILLTRFIDDGNADSTPLRYMMDLLIEPKAKPLVCFSLMQMIQNLLTLSIDGAGNEQTDIVPLEIKNCKPIDEKYLADISNAETINFGSKILLPFLPNILNRFKIVLRMRRGLTKRDLLILSKITGLITDAETSKTLLTVLLPILVRKFNTHLGEEVLTQMVNTIINLFKRINNPELHIRSIAPMFEHITAVGPRKLLCNLLKVIAERASFENETQKIQLHQTVRIVIDLNAWDRRWIEQPDYEKRLDAYKRIGKLTAANEIDLNAGLLIIHHSFYFIKYDKDMALRDSASHHLKTLLPTLILKLQKSRPQELDYLIGTVILNLVRRTFRDKNENVRTEGIQLLGEIARECPDAHPVLFDLNMLACKEDREIDFFDNITHLQIQRHGKALLRFGSVAKTLEKVPSTRTLTQFILPLATAYIANEKYSMNHGLVTSAIETIGAVCRLLPWHQYETILKYYIKNMRFNVQYQKQMVRIVMQILDSFHFDLSRANYSSEKLSLTSSLEPLATSENKSVTSNEETNNDGDADQSIKENETEEIVIQISNEQESFFEELNECHDENDEDEVEDDIPVKKARVCIYDKPIVLSTSIARKVIHNLATGLIPTLNNSITALSTYESFHKINKKKRRSEREEEEILRVPIALAVVKLLQKLPTGVLEQNLSGILIKVCMFLKSPLISVRMTTRDILKNIMITVGAQHLEMLLTHMTSLLTRGFQVHVLTITVHSLLDALKTSLKNGIMDKCLQYVLRVCLGDIFGQTGEEKLVTKIGKHTPEAKPHNKSFLTLGICATYLTKTCLLDLLVPLKEQLNRSQSKKNIIRVQECFQKIVAGLLINKQINIETMMMFIYGVISESIPDLMPEIQKPKLTANDKLKIKQQKPDCFLIPKDPAIGCRSNTVKLQVVSNVRANAHVLIEFGLELLHAILKSGKLLKINYQPFIDPIVIILNDSIGSSHVRVTTFALKCISVMIGKTMTSDRLIEFIKPIVEKIFEILHKYVAANTDMSNENFLLVQSSFKTIVNILRYIPAANFILTEEQLKTLLFYAEQYLDIGETNKQTISFSLLKVIISRRLVTRELNNVLMQVGRLAIQSESDVARAESKGIIVNYLMDYPLGKKVEGFIEFFISNLNYELQSGRESAISILHSIVKRFPAKYLNRKSALMFVACGSRIVNDESAKCRENIAECVETLISRIDVNQRNELFAIIITLLNDQKSSHREMAALLCTRFINVEKQGFSTRLEKILPVLVTTLFTSSVGKFVSNRNFKYIDKDGSEDDEEEDDHEENQRMLDHSTIQLQNTLLKIYETFDNVIIDFSQYTDELAYESQKLLAHEHTWVRLNALKMLQNIIQGIQVEQVFNGVRGKNQLNFIYANPEQELKSLTLDLCAQLIPDQTDIEMANEVTTILLHIANILKSVPFINTTDADDEDGDGDGNGDGDNEKESNLTRKRKINLPWLLRRLRYVVHSEVAKAPQSSILRSAVFRWIEGLAALITTEQVEQLAYTLLAPLVREMSEEDQNIDARLRKLAIHVGDTIRAKIGDDEYNNLRSQIQKKLMLRRAERKKIIAIDKISHPVQAAMRIKGMRDRKKAAKRRNFDPIKSHAFMKKKKKN